MVDHAGKLHAYDTPVAGAPAVDDAVAESPRRRAGGPVPGQVVEPAPPTSGFSEAINAGLGQSLPDGLRARFESSLGTDLGGVRVHTGGAAAASSQALGAHAYALGQNIFMGAGEYDPSSRDGALLLAHEVAHTVQQRGATASPQCKPEVGGADDALEHAADTAAFAMIAGAPAGPVGTTAGAIVQRQQHRFRGRPTRRDRMDALLAPDSPLWRQLNPDQDAPVNCPATAAAMDTYLGTGEVQPAPGGTGLATFPFVGNPRWSEPVRSIAPVRALLGPERFVVVEGTRPGPWAQQHNVTTTHYFILVRHRGHTYVLEPSGGFQSTDVAGYVRDQGFSQFRYAEQRLRVQIDEPNLDDDSIPL
jgi:hypothetical protein